MEDNLFWKNLTLAILFFTLTPIALGLSVFTLINLYGEDTSEHTEVLAAQIEEAPQIPSGVSVFAAIPSTTATISADVEVADARPELIRQYLRQYNSPIEHLADFIVEVADKNQIDFRLITAIAQQESNLCKRIPPETYNCWGWGIHSRGTLGFQSYEEGIETVSKGLKTNYIDKGLVDPEEIMTKYTPSSPEGAWAKGVNLFMGNMQ